MPKVTVIMPVYNGKHFVAEAMASVLAQRGTDLELIVSNDGSTDNTLEIVEAIAGQDARVRIMTRPNSGRPSFPKNDGIAAARGEYLCFLDHDDLYDADRTHQLVEGLEQHPEWVAAFHDLRLIDSAGGPMPGSYLADVDFIRHAAEYLTPLQDDWFECSSGFFIYQSLFTAALHTQSVLIAVNRLPANTVQFNTDFTICEDTDLWIRLGLLGKIGYLNRVLSSYRQLDTSITKNQEKFFADSVRMHQANLQRIQTQLSSEQVHRYRAKIAAGLEALGYAHYEKGRMRDARAAYRRSLVWEPGRTAATGYLKSLVPGAVRRGIKSLTQR